MKSEGGEGGADVDDGLLDDLGVVSPVQNQRTIAVLCSEFPMKTSVV